MTVFILMTKVLCLSLSGYTVVNIRNAIPKILNSTKRQMSAKVCIFYSFCIKETKTYLFKNLSTDKKKITKKVGADPLITTDDKCCTENMKEDGGSC